MRYIIMTIGVSVVIGCAPKNYPEASGNEAAKQEELNTKEANEAPKIFADSAFYDPNPVMERSGK